MKKAILSLPEGHKKAFSMDLEKNKRLALLVNGISLAIFLVMALVMHLFVPIFQLVMPQEGEPFWAALPRVGVLFVALLAYIFLHELTHGIAMKIFGASKINYGFTGIYAYAGSNAYFDKVSYIIISLAPIVVWGVVLTIINLLVPYNWIWTVYFIQIMNVAGAAGDFYVAIRLARAPSDVLVYDEGVGMVVYSAVLAPEDEDAPAESAKEAPIQEVAEEAPTEAPSDNAPEENE